MLFVVCGADCDNVGDIYECPQGTYAIGRRAPLQNNFIYTKTHDNKDICNTNNKLFMLLYNCNFMMYCMRFQTGFLFGGEKLRVYFATPIFWNLHYFDAHLCIRALYFTLMISVRSYALNGSVMIGT